MDSDSSAKKAMTRDEAALLKDLVAANPIITSKTTNAPSNKKKDDAWDSLTTSYNAKTGSVPKTKTQLQAKWDNLKKSAQKRFTAIRMNNIKTGGGKPDAVGGDELLDKVSGILGTTCTGYNVPYGGDAVEDIGTVSGDGEEEGTDSANVIILEDMLLEPPTEGPETKKIKIDFFGKPMASQLKAPQKGKKKAFSSKAARNMALAKYYKKKTEKIALEIKILENKLENNNQ